MRDSSGKSRGSGRGAGRNNSAQEARDVTQDGGAIRVMKKTITLPKSRFMTR